MEIKHAIVVDNEGFMVDYVLVDICNVDGEEVLYYELKEGEYLVFDDLEIALRMIRPQWNGKRWAEKAAKKEAK